ncbi:MAG: hypothetical protein ACFFCI_01090 [Promethearchaeota archaeon]
MERATKIWILIYITVFFGTIAIMSVVPLGVIYIILLTIYPFIEFIYNIFWIIFLIVIISGILDFVIRIIRSNKSKGGE